MLNIPTDLPSNWRYSLTINLFAGTWHYAFDAIGARGAVSLNISGPHIYGGGENWSAGLEFHSRTPRGSECAPSHDVCHVLKAPCWHDGTSLGAQERYLPLFLQGKQSYDYLFRR